MEAEHDQALVRLVLLRRENLAMFLDQLHRHVRHEVGVGGVREHQFLDAMNLVRTQLEDIDARAYQ